MRRRRGRRSRAVTRRRLIIGSAVVAAGVTAGALLGVVGKVDDAIQELTLPLRHEDIIRQQAAEKDIDASLVAAVIYAESRFRDQTSDAGARGLMQITPETALDIAKRSEAQTFVLKDLGDPQINISYGTYHLRDLLDQYEGNVIAALAAYNAGSGNVDRWGGANLTLDDIRFPETRGYVEDVLDKQRAYRDKYAEELGYR
ncbi:MAG TPA: lytic transglycosylase domain-containing protein [Solirubrobacterales bacterium]|nr:lytic transglycosylase domain-containing protein [Solirubrobacterales bacterium]